MAQAATLNANSDALFGLAGRLNPFVRVGMEHWRGPWFIEERRLLDYLLVYITAGTGRFSVGGETYEVVPGDLIWIPPDTLHEMRGHPSKMLVAYIHFDLVYDADRSPRVTITPAGCRELGALRKWLHPPWPWKPMAQWRGRLPVVNGPSVYALMKQVILESLGVHHPLRAAGLTMQLLGEIDLGLSSAATQAGAHWPALRRAAQQVVGQPDHELDLHALAHGAHLSLSHFRKLFRQTHGESPRTMHARARMQKACELVLHSGWSLTKVAAQLGFSTVHNFSRAFKREVGVPPRAYRQKILSMRQM